MRDADGNLTPAAIEVLNSTAIVWPDAHEMYPLSSIAADLGREGLVTITHGQKRGRNRMWEIKVTEEGWPFVTDPDAACEWRKRCALKRLGGEIYR
jgi:hypothetical protein